MAVHDHISRSNPFAVSTLLLVRAAAVLRLLRHALLPNASKHSLHEMSDHQLADVGMERDGLHDARFRRRVMEHPAYLPRNAASRPQQSPRLRRGP